ncbi:hypothetical protein [Spirosoma sp.]|uniref:hypothetical protein n=1 Tax=Spirosoma sp. TaxID=1899569 RepID=UPI003B3A414C
MKSDFWHIWAIPLWIGIISLFGLIAALVGNNLWDVMSWITLGIPLLLIGRFVWKPTSVKRSNKSR